MKTLTEANLTYEDAKKYIESHECGDCGGGLSLAWGGLFGVQDYVIRCSNDREHDNFVRPQRLSASQIPGFNLYQSKKQRRRKLVEEHGEKTGTTLQRFLTPGQLTEKRAELILRTIWPDASDEAILKGAMVCFNHGLDPLLKHVHLLPFKNREKGTVEWSVAIGIQASRLMAGRETTFSYVDDTPRIMTEEEQTKIFGKVDKSHIHAITKLMGPQKNVAVGYGKWSLDKEPKGTEKGNSKENMAFIRSERVALDRLSPGTLPADVEVIDAEYAEVPNVPLVDKDTGEITEPKVPEAKSEPETEEGTDNPYAHLLMECPEHTEAWKINKRFEKRFHPLPDKNFCNFKDQINPIAGELSRKVFKDQLAVHDWVRQNYSERTWSKLTEEEQVEVLGKLDAMANPPEPVPAEGQQASFGADDIPY